jgi:hypothetical protein
MNAYFDTAIIIKLYVQEATSPDAVRLVGDSPAPYLLMPWQDIEVRTAIRLKAFRKEITAAEMQASLDAFEEDLRSRRGKVARGTRSTCGYTLRSCTTSSRTKGAGFFGSRGV